MKNLWIEHEKILYNLDNVLTIFKYADDSISLSTEKSQELLSFKTEKIRDKYFKDLQDFLLRDE